MKYIPFGTIYDLAFHGRSVYLWPGPYPMAMVYCLDKTARKYQSVYTNRFNDIKPIGRIRLSELMMFAHELPYE